MMINIITITCRCIMRILIFDEILYLHGKQKMNEISLLHFHNKLEARETRGFLKAQISDIQLKFPKH